MFPLRPTLICLLFCLSAPLAQANQNNGWLELVRQSPYWISQGVYQNMLTIRQWVLTSSAYCERPDRHILYDRRGRFLGYINNEANSLATQQKLNTTRERYAASGRSDEWRAGTADSLGYPFALACDQPHVDLTAAVRRYLGHHETDRIWGTWDDLVIASPTAPLPLHDALQTIYATRLAQQRLHLPAETPLYLAGKLLIESGAQTRAHSVANARGIMQLSPAVLNDCDITERNHWHRMAQIDCALRLLNQNARNLQDPFEVRFGHLPAAKRDRLFTLLLTQAYHGGVGRVRSLLEDEELSRPTDWFARHHEGYSAGDIAFGMIFHNLGRNSLGLASLYYIADVELATHALCKQHQLRDTPFCHKPAGEPFQTDPEQSPADHAP